MLAAETLAILVGLVQAVFEVIAIRSPWRIIQALAKLPLAVP
jgi:hypothetical protein